MLIAFLFVAVIGKLTVVQIMNASSLQTKALDQWTRDVPITGERGDIYDVNGSILADTTTLYTVYVRPVAVREKEYTAKVLGSVLGIDSDNLFEKMNTKISEITVAKKVDKSQMNQLVSSDISGVYFSQNINRVYPYGDFMTQVLGFCNVDGMGQSGVESYYNNYLKGIDGYVLTQTDLVGRELDNNVTKYISGQKGNNVYLTLDYGIQAIVENAVNTAFEMHKSKSASCIVMNAKTGAILAMAQRPSYDLNNIPRDDIASLFGMSNSTLINGVYEPGSTFKILTTAIGLQTKAIDQNYTFYCPGYRMIDGQKIKCWKTKGHGSETFIEGVENSCNCLFMDIALKVGAPTFYEWINKFGLTTPTGIDISGETKGLTIPVSSVKNVDLARIGFGQAIAVSPIELVTASASVINGGKLMKPYILDKVTNIQNEIIVQNYPIVNDNTIDSEISSQMREILESVVANGGGRNAGVSGYRIGGKTGTAQKYVDGKIAQGKYVATFLGFAPANDPEYILLFKVDEPSTGVYYGSMVSAPFASQIFENIFAYKGIMPTENVEVLTKIEMPYLEGMTLQQATKLLKEKGFYYEISGEGDIVKSQVPIEGSEVTTKNVILIEV
ncbi:MAG: penicillin-binding transpeptidase domain-containing protein [Clostridia bacterium]